MYVSLFHSQTKLIDIIHKFFFSSALLPLTIITKDSVSSRVISLSPKLQLNVVFHCDKLREYKSLTFIFLRYGLCLHLICSFAAVECPTSAFYVVLVFMQILLCFFSRKNYKNVQKNNLVICVCVFLLLFESRDHVWPRDAPKRIPRTKNRLSLLVVFAKKCVPKSCLKFATFPFGFVSLLDSLNLF